MYLYLYERGFIIITMRIERARGTRDFLPAEMKKRRMIEAKMREIAERWGYEEISTPTLNSLSYSHSSQERAF